MRIAIGADISGFDLKEAVKKHLDEIGIEYDDFGTISADKPIEYYDIAPFVAEGVQVGKYPYAILFCGTGMGMAQIANSYKGVRAAVCESVLSAKMCRAINDSNILTMGGFFIAPYLANQMVDAFLTTSITEGMDDFHDFLLDAQLKIKQLEKKIYG